MVYGPTPHVARSKALAKVPPATLTTPQELTPELKDKLLDGVRSGHLVTRTCSTLGISKPTLKDWERRAMMGEPQFVELFKEITAAELQAEKDSLDVIKSSDDWKARAWFLSHRFDHWKENYQENSTQTVEFNPENLTQMLVARFDVDQIRQLVRMLQVSIGDG